MDVIDKLHIEELIQKLEHADIYDNKFFKEILNECMHLCCITRTDLGHRLGVCGPSIVRWTLGLGAPHPVMRRPVYAYLVQKLIELRDGKVYSFCESALAISNYPWHIRCLTSAGPKWGGGIDTEGLCGKPDLKWGGWDINVPLTKERLEKVACKKCLEIYEQLTKKDNIDE